MIRLHQLLQREPAPHARVCRGGSEEARAGAIDRAGFRASVSVLAARLREQGAQRYALCLSDPFEFACALYALFACGKEPVIPAHMAPGYLAALADAYDTLLTDADLHALAMPRPIEDASLEIDPLAPLTLFTSGSSGDPKAIRKSLAQFDTEVQTLEREWGASLGDATVLASVPHHHIYGLLFRVLWPLAAGRPFDRDTVLDPQQVQARIHACGATVVVATPAQLSRWPSLAGFAALDPPPRAFFSSGGPLAADAARAYREAFGAAPLEIYGSTETGGIAWRRQDEASAWRPLNGIEARRGADGALEVRSPHLGHADWHRTDDAAQFDEDGRFQLVGRLDRVIKLDGKRVSLTELEARLAQHRYVGQAALVPFAGASRDRLGALVALSAEGSAELVAHGRVALAKALRRHLASYFDTIVLPRRWRFRIALPYDARGKLPAAAVAAAFAARDDGFEVLGEARSGDVLHYELRVPPTLTHFAGHFPGLPILPGVVQLDWAIRLAAEHVTGVREVASVERLKFTAPVTPGAVLKLTLAHDTARRRVQFAYQLGERDCASGIVVYREAI
jgi:acyl-coenzyme A synthetase/AMP-(fatty) acid ligase